MTKFKKMFSKDIFSPLFIHLILSLSNPFSHCISGRIGPFYTPRKNVENDLGETPPPLMWNFPHFCFFSYIVSFPYHEFSELSILLFQLCCFRRCMEDEALMSAILGSRKRGFLLEIVERSEAGESVGWSYAGWKKVLTKLPSLQELRQSLQGLSSACSDISSDKVAN